MPKPPTRFTDTLVAVAEGEAIVPLVVVNRASTEYADGARARRAGELRDPTKPLSWIFGYDETPPPTPPITP